MLGFSQNLEVAESELLFYFIFYKFFTLETFSQLSLLLPSSEEHPDC